MLNFYTCHSCLSGPTRNFSATNACAKQSHHTGLYSCLLVLSAQPGKWTQNAPLFCWQLYWLQGKLSLGWLAPRTGWSCNTDIREFLSTSENKLSQSILALPAKASNPQYSHIKETSSKAEKLKKAVNPHVFNYVQQLQRNQNFFMSIDWAKAKRITYSLLLCSHFILCWTTWKPWENKRLAILLWKVKPKKELEAETITLLSEKYTFCGLLLELWK